MQKPDGWIWPLPVHYLPVVGEILEMPGAGLQRIIKVSDFMYTVPLEDK